MLLKSQKDFFSGLLFMTVGGAFAYGATTYQVGTAARMGPGYFPLLLGVILALMGAVIAVRSFIAGTPDGDHIGAIAWKPLLLVLGANVAFGALMIGVPSLGIPQFGLVVAIFAQLCIASLAAERFVLTGHFGCGQLCGIRRVARVAVSRVAQFHRRLMPALSALRMN